MAETAMGSSPSAQKSAACWSATAAFSHLLTASVTCRTLQPRHLVHRQTRANLNALAPSVRDTDAVIQPSEKDIDFQICITDSRAESFFIVFCDY